MENIKLIDCTLGLGGKLIDWNYGEDMIRQIRMLLQKSCIDLIELGLLRKQERGPNCAISNTTVIPPAIKRQEGQLYALLLDEYYPPLADLPEHGKDTVDIIRVEVSAKNLPRALAYSQEMMKKGYHIHILLTETAQYDEVELSRILREIKLIHPWACSVYDSSGVIDEEELRTVFALCDDILYQETIVGFHGCDNLGKVMDLTKYLCTMNTGRDLIIESSASGIGVGAAHMSTWQAAKQLVQGKKANYNTSVIQYLEELVHSISAHEKWGSQRKDNESKNSQSTENAKTRLLYHAAAECRCSYLYPEYYSELSIDAAEQLGIFSDILREDAFHFTRSAANHALMSYRKKLLNMVIVVPIADSFEKIDRLLSYSAEDLLRYGVDLVIFDYSSTEVIHAVTDHYQIQGYSNLFYTRYEGETGSSMDEIIIAAYRAVSGYDYVWMLESGWIPTVQLFYQDLLRVIKTGADYITVDCSFRNSDQYIIKYYDQCLHYFEENCTRITMLGTLILKETVVRKLLENHPLKHENGDLWLPVAVLRQISSEDFRAALIISDVFLYNSGVPGIPELSMGKDIDVLYKWVDHWEKEVSDLPEVYNSEKMTALRVQMFDYHPFHVRSMLSMRVERKFNLSVYRQYRNALSIVSDTPGWKFYAAALTPRWLAKLILRLDHCAETEQSSMISRCLYKLKHIFIRLGA